MKTGNHSQFELALQPTPGNEPFFHVRRRSPETRKHRLPKHRLRSWFQRMHQVIDAIPEPERT